MRMKYLVAVRGADGADENEIFSFDSKVDRAGFVKEMKRLGYECALAETPALAEPR